MSFGGAWPGSRIRYDEGGHSGRFRLGGLGLVQSRRDDDRGDGPFGDGRQDAGPGFRPVDVVMVRCRVRPQPPRPGPATRGSPGPVDGRGPSESCAGRCPEPALAKAGGGGRLDYAAESAGRPASAQHIGVVNTVATRVISLSPMFARPGASPRSRHRWTSSGRCQAQGEGGRKEQAGIVHQAVIVKDDLRSGRGGGVAASCILTLARDNSSYVAVRSAVDR